MSGKVYFGTDGIRGRVGVEPITADFMLRVGHALGSVLREAHGHAEVLIGKDTRVSGYMFESALEAGLVAAGAGVQLLGPMPTPAVAWLTRAQGASAGIVISASHNPYYDNGVKFFNAAGEKLSDEIELAIERRLAEPMRTVASEQIGKAVRIADGPARYEAFCSASIDSALDLRGRRIVLDCAHGATYQIAPRLFADFGADVVTIGAQPDGFNINADCGATHPGALRAAVLAQKADLGIAFDGDGDRVQFIDQDGALVDGDDIVYLLAKDLIAQGRLKGPVVGTLMTNFGVEQAILRLGAPFLRSRVGDRYVLQMLKEHGGMLGGEASGHVLCLDRTTTGDGILTALLVLDALRRAGTTLAQARAGVVRVPQITLNVPVARAAGEIVADARVQGTFARIRENLSGRGRVVLRPSGTEPLVRVTVEGADESEVRALAVKLADAVKLAAS